MCIHIYTYIYIWFIRRRQHTTTTTTINNNDNNIRLQGTHGDGATRSALAQRGLSGDYIYIYIYIYYV